MNDDLKEIILFIIDCFSVSALVIVVTSNSEIIYSQPEKTMLCLLVMTILRIERLFKNTRKLNNNNEEP